VIAYAPCHGFPCAILAVDAASGAVDTLVPAAGPAAVAGRGDATLVFERGGRLTALDLSTLAETVVPASEGLVPLRSGSGANAGLELPPGEALLAPTGHAPDPSTSRRFKPAATRIEPAMEVLP
jgi:hypothetical protein